MERATPEEAAARERERTAYQLKTRYRWLNRFTDDELRDMSFCNQGEPLKANEEYVDLSHPEKGIIMGRTGEQVPDGSCYVARSDLRPSVWQKLITVTKEEFK